MADLSINTFKANFLGGARPSLYSVEMTFPAAVQNSALAAKKLQFLCKIAAIPGSTTGTIELPYMSRKIPIPGDKTFQPISLTILNDTDWAVRQAFEEWTTVINTHETNIGAVKLTDMTTDFHIHQLNRDGSTIKSYKLVTAFPTELSEISLGYENNDQIEEWTCTITYSYWQTESIF
jgi:hypothetical protein